MDYREFRESIKQKVRIDRSIACGLHAYAYLTSPHRSVRHEYSASPFSVQFGPLWSSCQPDTVLCALVVYCLCCFQLIVGRVEFSPTRVVCVSCSVGVGACPVV